MEGISITDDAKAPAGYGNLERILGRDFDGIGKKGGIRSSNGKTQGLMPE